LIRTLESWFASPDCLLKNEESLRDLLFWLLVGLSPLEFIDLEKALPLNELRRMELARRTDAVIAVPSNMILLIGLRSEAAVL
jgi:hypothetical protein